MRCLGNELRLFLFLRNLFNGFAFFFRLFDVLVESSAIKYSFIKSIDLQYNGSVNKLFVPIT
jgi:hypothetical protein